MPRNTPLARVPQRSGSSVVQSHSGLWRQGLYDCGNDSGLSCLILFCSCNAIGQIFERTTKYAGSCLLISIMGWILFIAVHILSETGNTLTFSAIQRQCEWWGCSTDINESQIAIAYILELIAGLVALVGSIIATYLLCTSRHRIRERDNIDGTGVDDCCVSYWCQCCTLVQLFAHEGLNGSTYRPCSTTGSAEAV